MPICRRPRHREIIYRLAADGVTELPAPPGRSLPSEVTGEGAACAPFWGREGVAGKKMQTEEETAAAEEPILEEGSGREQVRTFSLSPWALHCKQGSSLPKGERIFAHWRTSNATISVPLLPKQPAVSMYSTCFYTLISVLFHWQNMSLPLFSPRCLTQGHGGAWFSVNGDQAVALVNR